jgi:foldase protein PrsA
MRWIMVVIVVAFLLSTFWMYDFGSNSSSGGGGDYAVADINGRRLMRSALEGRVLNFIEDSGNRELSSADMPFVYQTVLDQYAIELQIAQEVRDSGILISDAEADQAVKEYADRVFPTREAFYQSLERAGIKIDDYRQSVAQQIATQRLLQESVEVPVISEDEAVAFYDGVKTFFFRQAPGFMVDLASFSSRDEAERVRGALLEGKPWKEATDDAEPARIIEITASPVFIPASAFDSYLSPMKSEDLGAVSVVFETASDDFAVGVKREEVAEKIAPYDEVSADIHAILRQQKEREALEAFSQRMLGRANIVIHDASLFPAADLTSPVPEKPVSGD